MKFPCKVLPIISLCLMPGIATLAAPVTSETKQARKVVVYTLSATNAGMSFIRSCSGCDIDEVETTTLRAPRLFGDPPNVALNNSPQKFLKVMLDDPLSEEEVNDIKTKLQKDVSDGAEIALVVSAAGADAAQKTLLTPGAEAVAKLKDAISGTNELGPDFVQKLESNGCFAQPDKASFHLCGFRVTLKDKLGYDFNPQRSFIEQDTLLVDEMANLLAISQGSTAQDHYILHSTTLAQPYAHIKGKIAATPGWLNTNPVKGKPFCGKQNTYMNGGTYEGGFRAVEQCLAPLYSETTVDTAAQDLLKRMEQSTDPAVKVYLKAMTYVEKQSGGIYNGNKKLSLGEVFLRMFKKEDMPQGLGFENLGQISVLASQTPKSATMEALELSKQELDDGLMKINGILNETRGSAGVNLLLFAGLVGPRLDVSADLMLIGEQADWLNGIEGQTFADLIAEKVSSPDFQEEFYNHYARLTTKVFADFDKSNQVKRQKGTHMTHGMTKEEFIGWMSAALPTLTSKVSFTPAGEYSTYMSQAASIRYVELINQ